MSRRFLLIGAGPRNIRCGVGDYVRRLAQGLQNSGALATLLIAGDRRGPREGAQSRMVMEVAGPAWGLLQLPSLLRSVSEADCELVHVHYPSQNYERSNIPWILPLLCRLIRQPVVVTLHEPVSLVRAYRLLALRLSGATLVTVRANYRQLLGRTANALLGKQELHYIRSASTLPRSSFGAGQLNALRVRYGNPERLLLFFGFLYPAKGAHRLLDLNIGPDDHLVFAGATPDADYLAMLKRSVREKGITDQVSFLGEVSATDAANLIAASDALVLPFELGGGEWNTSISAGVLNGTFVLTTSRDRQGYDASENVYYTAPGSGEQLSAALDKFSRGELVPAETPGLAYSWDNCAAAHLDVYLSAVGADPDFREP
ncbi:MAG: glycosyltransferase family 4 protein [Congregibacter sp.]